MIMTHARAKYHGENAGVETDRLMDHTYLMLFIGGDNMPY